MKKQHAKKVFLHITPMIGGIEQEGYDFSLTVSTDLHIDIYRTNAEAMDAQKIYGGLVIETTANKLKGRGFANIGDGDGLGLITPQDLLKDRRSGKGFGKAPTEFYANMVCGKTLPFTKVLNERGEGDERWDFKPQADTWLRAVGKQGHLRFCL